jgi:hypothetical protein
LAESRLKFSWVMRNRIPVSIAALAIAVVIAAYLIFSTPAPGQKGDLQTGSGTGRSNAGQTGSTRPSHTEVSQDISASKNSQLRKVRINMIGGQGDVYDSGGEWKSKTPYEFNERIGQEVKLVLKREGCVDQAVSFRVSEDNMYDFTMEKTEKDRR